MLFRTTSPGPYAVRDSPASDFPLRETGKSDKGIVQFLNWTMKATYVAFGHDSNPLQRKNPAGPNGLAGFLARCKGFEPLTFWSVVKGWSFNIVKKDKCTVDLRRFIVYYRHGK